MRKMDNFVNSLRILHKVDFSKTGEDEIYRMGAIGQFNLTFEMAWKALQETMREEGVFEAETGSPRDIVKLAYAHKLLSEPEQWLLMLKKRNISIHIYDEEQIDELLVLIEDSFLPALDKLELVLRERQPE